MTLLLMEMSSHTKMIILGDPSHNCRLVPCFHHECHWCSRQRRSTQTGAAFKAGGYNTSQRRVLLASHASALTWRCAPVWRRHHTLMGGARNELLVVTMVLHPPLHEIHLRGPLARHPLVGDNKAPHSHTTNHHIAKGTPLPNCQDMLLRTPQCLLGDWHAANVPTKEKFSIALFQDGKIRALLRGAKRCPTANRPQAWKNKKGLLATQTQPRGCMPTVSHLGSEVSSQVGGGLTRGDSPRAHAELTGTAN